MIAVNGIGSKYRCRLLACDTGILWLRLRMAFFSSYPMQDEKAAHRCMKLRAAALDLWLGQNDLRAAGTPATLRSADKSSAMLLLHVPFCIGSNLFEASEPDLLLVKDAPHYDELIHRPTRP